MNYLIRAFTRRTCSLLLSVPKRPLIDPKFLFSVSSVRKSIDDYVIESENLYWDRIRQTIERDEDEEVEHEKKSNSFELDKRVFVLQLRMQFKSKARQSTTPELQLAESISLVQTLNWKVIDSVIIGAKHASSREIFGSGNQEMLFKRIAASGANCLFVVIDRLTNSQVDALSKTLLGNDHNIVIYDRFKIVLEIFKSNARSSIAKLQIALAEIPYIRHRYENDQLYKIVEKKIKKELDKKVKTRSLLNAERRNKKFPIVSVFGYTNVGKTSFIKLLTNDAKLEPENKLFATLDVSYHGTSISNSSQMIIFADTIGFISDIPHTLIEAFKTSLTDTLNSDLYIHLVDISHPDRVAQEQSVIELLSDLAPPEKLKNMITIYNKCDKVDNLNELSSNSNDSSNAFYISCKSYFGLNQIKEEIEKKVVKQLNYLDINLLISQGGPEQAYLYKNAIIKEINECDQNDSNLISVRVLLNREHALKFIKLFPHVKVSK